VLLTMRIADGGHRVDSKTCSFDSGFVRDLLALLVEHGYPEATPAKVAEVAGALHEVLAR
jgi:hypothetical protein